MRRQFLHANGCLFHSLHYIRFCRFDICINTYDIDEWCAEIENDDFMNPHIHEWLQRRATFEVHDFVFGLCKLGTVFEYYDAIQKIRYVNEESAGINSVFDIAWYSFARMVADVVPLADGDMDYNFSQGFNLTCMCCREYFVRHSGRQRYCDNSNCKAERNNRKAKAYYKRKKTENL